MIDIAIIIGIIYVLPIAVIVYMQLEVMQKPYTLYDVLRYPQYNQTRPEYKSDYDTITWLSDMKFIPAINLTIAIIMIFAPISVGLSNIMSKANAVIKRQFDKIIFK